MVIGPDLLSLALRQAAELPGLPVTRTVIALDEFLAGKWGADNGAVQLVVAPLARIAGSARRETPRSSLPCCGPSPPTLAGRT
jgi:hypothetical protein